MSATASTVRGPVVALKSLEWPGALAIKINASDTVATWDAETNPRVPLVHTRDALRANPVARIGVDVIDSRGRTIELRVVQDGRRGDSRASVAVKPGTESVDLPLDVPMSRGLGVAKHQVTWCWQYRPQGQRGWAEFARTRHDLYIVLDRPVLPWGQPGDDPHELPWTDALDVACSWAAGAETMEAAAGAITRRLHTFSRGSRRAMFGDNRSFFQLDDEDADWCGSIFRLTDFLDLLEGRSNDSFDWRWSCAVCSTAAQTFAAILGCSLRIKKLVERFNATYDLNPIWLIGEQRERPEQFFHLHEVAIDEPSRRIFDACLRLDEDADPSALPAEWAFPVNWDYPLYVKRLVAHAQMADIGPYHRFVDRLPEGARLVANESVVMRRTAFLQRLTSDAERSSLTFNRDYRLFALDLEGFDPPMALAAESERFPEAWRPIWAWRWQSASDPDIAVRLTVFAPPTRERAMRIISALCGRVANWRFDANQPPQGRKHGDGGMWDYAFIHPEATVAIFLMGNLALELVSDGFRDIDVTQMAGDLSIAIAPLLG